MHDDTPVELLTRVIERLDLDVIGIAGPPGGGKSTLARSVAERLGRTLVLSLDDFYLPKADRVALGLVWRGPPGSHDVEAFVDVLDRLRAGRMPVELPRFSDALDDRIEPVTLDVRPEHVIVEGWVLGHRAHGYEAILERLDLLVYFGVPVELARARRYQREAVLRGMGGGFSVKDMDRFWNEVLEPGIHRWVRQAMDTADLVIDVDDTGRLRDMRANDPAVAAVLGDSGYR